MFKTLEHRGFSVTLEIKLNCSTTPQPRGETGHTVIATGLPVKDGSPEDDTTKDWHIDHHADLGASIADIESQITTRINTHLDGSKLSMEEMKLKELGFSKS